MAEYNGVTLEPLMDGSQDRDYQVEQFIFWGAGRAAALALSPKFSSVALCANATYMVTRIAHLYEVELQSGAVVGLVGGLSTAVGTAAISLLVPLKAVRVPVAVGLGDISCAFGTNTVDSSIKNTIDNSNIMAKTIDVNAIEDLNNIKNILVCFFGIKLLIYFLNI